MLMIANDGPLILSTNYWDTPLAQRGLVFLSINAGAFRLLLPDALESALGDMRTAREVIISRGPWPDGKLVKMDAVEIMFEDDSDSPFAVHIGTEQLDRLPLDTDAELRRTCTVWTNGPSLRLELPAYYRRVPRIPWMKGMKKE